MSADKPTENKTVRTLPLFCSKCGTFEPEPLEAAKVLHNPQVVHYPPVFWLKLNNKNEINHIVVNRTGFADNLFVFCHNINFPDLTDADNIVCAKCGYEMIDENIKRMQNGDFGLGAPTPDGGI